jgi:hypothetical protein
MQPQRQHRSIVLEISTSGENGPAAAVGGGADQKIDRRSGDAPGSAAVVHVGGFLVVRHFERVLLKGPEVVTQLSKLGFLANAA